MLRYKKEIADGAMIHCPKEEDARLLCRYLEAHGCKEETACNSTTKIADDMVYEIHKDRYYQFDYNHPQIVANCNYGYHVIEFSDLIFPKETEPLKEQELSAKDLTYPLKSVRFRFTEDVRETYPELLGRSFSLKEIDDIYHRIIDKEEYHSFDGWYFDMLRSGLLVTAQDER